MFCHYVATGRVLRQRISAVLEDHMLELATQKLACGRDEVMEQLERIAGRFDDKEAPLRLARDAASGKLIQDYPALSDRSDALAHIVRRFMRTPSFLVRYFPLAAEKLDEAAMTEALAARDASGMSLEEVLRGFFEFLAKRCSSDERERYLEALAQLQTGAHYGADVDATYSDDELQGEKTEALLPNVRLVNGATKQDTRQRLMLTFNTPFYPEILIASSVMAEGVDLHLSCRFVIHHDLCWNPSTLEQRTGRIDRIGAKCERSRQPVVIYLPYLGETQDEKMYRVVMDRERWFSVVMGEKYTTDARSTDRIAERVPLPEAAAKELAFRLDVP